MPAPRLDTAEDLESEMFRNNAQQWLAYIRDSYDYLQQAEAQEEADQATRKAGALETLEYRETRPTALL
ncbi:hypothetical protein CFE70_008556 [Pyrenophora teres f. teres 0-1]|nr:hypothetical protein P3342_011739 [Pyrenophora teres f. teres]